MAFQVPAVEPEAAVRVYRHILSQKCCCPSRKSKKSLTFANRCNNMPLDGAMPRGFARSSPSSHLSMFKGVHMADNIAPSLLQIQLLVFYRPYAATRYYASSGTSPGRSGAFGATAQRSSNFSLWRFRGRCKRTFEPFFVFLVFFVVKYGILSNA